MITEGEISQALDVLRSALLQRNTQVTTLQNENQQLVRKLEAVESKKPEVVTKAVSLPDPFPLQDFIDSFRGNVMVPATAHFIADRLSEFAPGCASAVVRECAFQKPEEHHTFRPINSSASKADPLF